MFPPGNATAEVAIAEHLRYRGSWFADLVGPLLVPAKAFDVFGAAHREARAPELRVVLIGTSELPATVPDGVTVLGFELPVAEPPIPEAADGLSMAVEIAAGPAGERVLAATAAARSVGRNVVAKFRTGGVTADALPSEGELAEVICAAGGVPVPLKLTAGLHHAVRSTDRTTGFEHHGFLNVVVAVARASTGAGPDVVSEILAVRSAPRLVAAVGDLTERQVTGLRERFVSFGCCGVEDPIGDLVDLGLVNPEERA